jgi:hypothetical protein
MERLRKRPLPHFILVQVYQDNMGSLIVEPLERTEEFKGSAYFQFEDDQNSFWEDAFPHTCWSIKSTVDSVNRGWWEKVFISDEFAECLFSMEGEYA